MRFLRVVSFMPHLALHIADQTNWSINKSQLSTSVLSHLEQMPSSDFCLAFCCCLRRTHSMLCGHGYKCIETHVIFFSFFEKKKEEKKITKQMKWNKSSASTSNAIGKWRKIPTSESKWIKTPLELISNVLTSQFTIALIQIFSLSFRRNHFSSADTFSWIHISPLWIIYYQIYSRNCNILCLNWSRKPFYWSSMN